MAQVRVTASVDQARLRAFVEQEVAAGVLRACGRVRDVAKAEITAAGRVDTGQMRNGVVAEVERVEGERVVGRVISMAEHSSYQHEGTRSPILPRRARVLRFRPKGSGVFIFRPEVSGVQGYPFLTNALERLGLSDFT